MNNNFNIFNNELKKIWKNRLYVFHDYQLAEILKNINKPYKDISREEMINEIVKALENKELYEYKINFFVND